MDGRHDVMGSPICFTGLAEKFNSACPGKVETGFPIRDMRQAKKHVPEKWKPVFR
jgi:hypothetical protein